MFVFRWIQMSLILMLLHLTAVTGQYSSFVIRGGDDVTLPCENVAYVEHKCENTSWFFSGAGNTPSVQLVGFGEIGENANTKRDRLSVTENCSLVLKTVTDEDVGRYSCRQFKGGDQQGQDAHVYLSVITKYEHEDNDTVTFSCSASTYGWCTQRLKWLLKGEGTTTVRTIQKNREVGSANDDAAKPQDWLRFSIVSVGLAALIITVVAVNVWTRTRGNKTQTDGHIVHNDKDDYTVNYENLGDLHASVRLHR